MTDTGASMVKSFALAVMTKRHGTGIKFVLRSAYEGEDYKKLGQSHDELAQGHFMSSEFLRHCLEGQKLSKLQRIQNRL
jgi:hypothetical protein